MHMPYVPPGGEGLHWNPLAVAAFVGGELVVGLSFVLIGIAIFRTVHTYQLGKVASRLVPLLKMFSVFIFCSGFTRIGEAMVIFFPVFWVVVAALLFTSITSLLTCWQIVGKRTDLLVALGAEKRNV